MGFYCKAYPPPPHTTHALQPCDIGVFKPLKHKCVSRFVMANDDKTVDKSTFAQVFKMAWEETHKASVYELLQIGLLIIFPASHDL